MPTATAARLYGQNEDLRDASSEADQPPPWVCFAVAAQSPIRLLEDRSAARSKLRTFASSPPKRAATGACSLLGDRLDARAAAIDLSAAGPDDRQERWIAADACFAGRTQKSCSGIVDTYTSIRAAPRTSPDWTPDLQRVESALDARGHSTAELCAAGASHELVCCEHQSSHQPAGARAAGIGQPQPRDRPSRMWLLSAADGNACPLGRGCGRSPKRKQARRTLERPKRSSAICAVPRKGVAPARLSRRGSGIRGRRSLPSGVLPRARRQPEGGRSSADPLLG